MTSDLTRRSAILSATLLPLAAGMVPAPAAAKAPPLGPATPDVLRFPFGGWEVTTVHIPGPPTDNPQATFGLNVSAEEFAAQAAAYRLPVDKWRSGYTPTLVNTGEMLVLFDTGPDGKAITAALAAAGIAPEAVDLVVLTHLHGDHIGGLMTDGARTFPQARYATGRAEFDHWAGAQNARFESHVRPLESEISFLADGDGVIAGITALLTPGHTPGHMAFRLETGGKVLFVTGDVTNHYAFSLARPDWNVRFDMDKPQAAATRRRVLGQLAGESIPFIGYHMPFPSVGYVVSEGDGFRYLPLTYQFALERPGE